MVKKQANPIIVLQHDHSDCGVACLLSLVQFYGGTSTLEKLRELSGTSKQGTTLLGLYQSANKLGFTADGCEADIDALIEHAKPVILHVLIDEKLQHYVVCYGYDATKKVFTIGDPAKGIYYLTRKELDAIWESKSCLTLEPNQQFVTANSLKGSKKEWFLNLLQEDYPLLRISMGLGVVIAALGMAMAIFNQKLIDDILPSKDFNKLVTGIGLLTFLLLVRVLVSILREHILIKQSKDFNIRIVDQFYTALIALPKPFFDTRKIGELVARLNDTRRIQRVIKLLVTNSIIDLLVVLISFGFLFYYSWQTGLICLVCLPFYFLLLYRFNKPIINAQKNVMQGYAQSEGNFITSMQGIQTIKSDNKQSLFVKLNQLIYGNFQDKVFDLSRLNIRLSLLSGIFSVLFLIAVLAFNAFSVYHQTLQLGELMAILTIASNILPSIANLALISIPINEAKIAFDRMFEYGSIDAEKAHGNELTIFNNLQLKNLSFRFPGHSQLLQDINLTVSKGTCIAIVGESGSGKTTLGQIIQQSYGFEGGEILINNNIELNDISLNSWRDLVGVIPQEITIFNGNVLSNIVIDEEKDPSKIETFLTSYGFDQYFSSLPQGIATIVGEEGINLSGGQKQVIGIARALYKNPQLLIMDEATSSMDRNTEKFTLNLLKKVKSKIAIIFISHRLHSLKTFADQIYVIENGKTVAYGAHEKLMADHNFYSEFFHELETS